MPPWTYSQIDSFESCPRKFYHLKVVRDVVDPPSQHAEWGTRVHTAMENYVKDQEPLPEGMTHWKGIADKITKLPGEKFCEMKMSLDKNFQPTEWKTSWSRGIADLTVVNGKKAATLDYKTGRRKPSEQLELYAAYTFAYFPDVQQVTTMYVWLKEKKVDKATYERDQLPMIWQGMLPRVRKLESAYERDKWPAKPSGLCKSWCPCMECEFNGQRGKR